MATTTKTKTRRPTKKAKPKKAKVIEQPIEQPTVYYYYGNKGYSRRLRPSSSNPGIGSEINALPYLRPQRAPLSDCGATLQQALDKFKFRQQAKLAKLAKQAAKIEATIRFAQQDCEWRSNSDNNDDD